MKKILSLILSTVLALSLCVSVSASTTYYFNNMPLTIHNDAIYRDGMLYVPVYQSVYYANVKVSEDKGKGTVTVEALGRTGYFTLTANSNIARKNGVNIIISGTPFMSGDVLFGPADFLTDQLGLLFSYDSANNIVHITYTEGGNISNVTEPLADTPSNEKMVTKSQLEAEGRGPDSVNWRYQEDYLANKPIPESALIYKPKTAAAPATSGEKMVTKSQLEAAGKGPDSVNWRYQEDYLANKPIPESALIYKPKTQKKASSSSSSSYKPSEKGLIDDLFSPLTDTFDMLFGEGAAEHYQKYGTI